jgi:hypothetical protein
MTRELEGLAWTEVDMNALTEVTSEAWPTETRLA